MTAAISRDPEVVEAIHANRLSAWSHEVLADPDRPKEQRQIAVRALDTCTTISTLTETEAQRLVGELAHTGIESETTTSDQRHSILIDVDPDDAPKALSILQRDGFSMSREWTGAAARSFYRFARDTTLTKSAEHSTVVRLRWQRREPSHSKPREVLSRVFTPTSADWALIDLPKPLWWAYGAVRPIRLVAERLGFASRSHGGLEPFLVTPDALLEPLFDVAELTEEDVFADIGCGDGRIVVAAAQRHGCRALGIEQSASSVAAARNRVARAGLSDRVTIVHANAHDADLSEITAALLFVPMVVAVRLIPAMSGRLAPGAHIVLHEQSRLPADLPKPSHSVAVVARQAVTVAHHWNP